MNAIDLWFGALALGAFFGFIAAMMFIAIFIDRKQHLYFERYFPPISDDEFMAKMPAGTNREIALKVRRIVADQLFVEYERIHPECRFVEDLGAD